MSALSRSLAIIESEPDSTIVNANENLLKLMGYALDEINGKHHRMFAAPQDANKPDYLTFWQKLRSGQFDAGKTYRIIKCATDITAINQPSAKHGGCGRDHARQNQDGVIARDFRSC